MIEMKKPELSLGAWAELAHQMSQDLQIAIQSETPAIKTYTVKNWEDRIPETQARQAAFQAMSAPMVKQAFDSRRVDQEHDRNPRANGQ